MAKTLENQGFQRLAEAYGDHEKSAFHLPRRGMLITEAEQRKTKAEARNNAVKDK